MCKKCVAAYFEILSQYLLEYKRNLKNVQDSVLHGRVTKEPER